MHQCESAIIIYMFRISLVAQLVKNLPAMQETLVQSLGREGPLEKGKAAHSSILACRISWRRKESDMTARLSLLPDELRTSFHLRIRHRP